MASIGEATKGFDPYETIGIILPGSIVALQFTLEVPQFRNLLGKEGLSVGDLGLLIIAAYVFGHLIQAFGNLFESAYWRLFKLPTNRVLSVDQELITPLQREQLAPRGRQAR